MLTDYDAYARTEPAEAARETWRREVLALMAGERAILLEGLLGLDAATLTNDEIFEGYTVRDLLAHIAAWDDFHQERMALTLDGRAAEIAPIEVHEHNAALYQAHQTWSLAQSVSALQTARVRFLETLADAPDATLHRPVSIPWADTLPLRTWAVWRARHDAVHGAEITAWRAKMEPPYAVGPREFLLAALAASRNEMEALSALVAPQERASRPVYGDWTLRDVFGHLADWEAFAQQCLEAGEMLDMGYEGEVQQWNEAHARARRSEPWASVWADYVQVRERLLVWVAAQSDAALAQLIPNPWGQNTPAGRFVHWFLEHEREHAHGLRDALLAPVKAA